MVYQETFANGFDGSNGNGAWTVEDNVEGINSEEIWVWVAPGNVGYYADGTKPARPPWRQLQRQHR